MRRSRKVLGGALAALFLLIASFPALAQDTAGFFSASYLHELCRSDAKGREVVKGGHTACQAYIAGTIDYHKLMKTLGTAPTIDFCVPNTEPMSRLQLIVWKFLAENGQHSEFVAAPAVTLALYEYYPCKAQQPAKKKESKRYKR
jgi:hypothetical protein